MKKVRLVYLDADEAQVSEHVMLVDESHEVFLTTGQKLDFTVGDILNKSDYVMFEDEEGLFGMKPEHIISVEPLEV